MLNTDETAVDNHSQVLTSSAAGSSINVEATNTDGRTNLQTPRSSVTLRILTEAVELDQHQPDPIANRRPDCRFTEPLDAIERLAVTRAITQTTHDSPYILFSEKPPGQRPFVKPEELPSFTPPCPAVLWGYQHTMNLLQGSTVKSFYTKFQEACERDQLKDVQYLIQTRRTDIEATNKHGSTPLIIACQHGTLEVVKYLVETCHANIEATNKYGATPLIMACITGKLEVVKYLVKTCHANIEATNEYGSTPLILACIRGHLEVVKYLVATCHANVNAQNNERRKPLQCAVKARHTVIADYLKPLTTEASSALPAARRAAADYTSPWVDEKPTPPEAPTSTAHP